MAPFTEACIFNHTPRSVEGRIKTTFFLWHLAASETNEAISSRATKATEAK